MNKRTGRNHPSVKDKRDVIERDGGLCVIRLPGCLVYAQTTDHRANRQAGGSRVLNDGVNLIGACCPCNDAKSRAHGDVRENLERRGINVLPSSTHAKTLDRARETPVTYPDGTRWLLISATSREPYRPA